jgi:hypothetical protein
MKKRGSNSVHIQARPNLRRALRFMVSQVYFNGKRRVLGPRLGCELHILGIEVG